MLQSLMLTKQTSMAGKVDVSALLQALIAMSTLTPIAVASITGTRLTCLRRASWCQQLRGYAATVAQGFELEVLSQFLGMVLNAISDSFMTPPRSVWAFTLDE